MGMKRWGRPYTNPLIDIIGLHIMDQISTVPLPRMTYYQEKGNVQTRKVSNSSSSDLFFSSQALLTSFFLFLTDRENGDTVFLRKSGGPWRLHSLRYSVRRGRECLHCKITPVLGLVH